MFPSFLLVDLGPKVVARTESLEYREIDRQKVEGLVVVFETFGFLSSIIQIAL